MDLFTLEICCVVRMRCVVKGFSMLSVVLFGFCVFRVSPGCLSARVSQDAVWRSVTVMWLSKGFCKSEMLDLRRFPVSDDSENLPQCYLCF